jgi:glycerol kinase
MTTIVAIDQGTTSTRAIAFGSGGQSRLLLSREHRQFYPKPGWVEHDPRELMAILQECCAAAGECGDLAALGLDNQGESCLAWDARTGEAVTPVIVWQDARTEPAIEALKLQGAGAMVRQKSGLPLDAYFSASKLGWMLAELPQVRRLHERGHLRLGTTDAFFRDRLTGRFETDVTTASRTALMNLKTLNWDPELCRLFGVPLDALPVIGPSAGDLGLIRCGAKRVALTASLVDQQASLYGHGCRCPGDLKMTFGTGAFLLGINYFDGSQLSNEVTQTVGWQKSGEPPVFALEGGVYSAASALNWCRGLGLFKDFSELAVTYTRSAASKGLVFVPALSGLACPHWDRSARGSWMGLSLHTTATDMVQAVLEGVAFRTAEVFLALERNQPVTGKISLDGRMTENAFFVQFLSNVLQRELSLSSEPEMTAIGTATLAAEATGVDSGYVARQQVITPGESCASLQELFTAARTAATAFAGSARKLTSTMSK